MTNEQTVLAYLYTVPSIKRKQLAVALPDMPYQCLTRATRQALEHGYAEYVTADRCRYIRLTGEGKRYIRSAAGNMLNRDKRRAFTINADKESYRRFDRKETARNLCKAAGIPLASETGITFEDILGNTEKGRTFFAREFPANGAFFASEDVSRSIKKSHFAEDEVSSTGSRYVGVILNRNGLFFVYNTLNKLMRFPERPEQAITNGLFGVLTRCGAFDVPERKAMLLHVSAVVIGKSDAMLPKIYRGTKWGVAEDSRYANPAFQTLLSLDNLHRHFRHTFFVPANTLGVELLRRTACIPFALLERMKEQWLHGRGAYTFVRSNGYLEAYQKGEKEKTVILPILSFEELTYHAAKRERVHVICERGTSEGISRVLGPVVETMRDFDDAPLPFHRYDENGVRMDGTKPFYSRKNVVEE